jgi:hypothetical protein
MQRSGFQFVFRIANDSHPLAGATVKISPVPGLKSMSYSLVPIRTHTLAALLTHADARALDFAREGVRLGTAFHDRSHSICASQGEVAVHTGIRRSAALLAFFVGVVQAQSVEFRQLRLGMTLDEVQAMTPGIEWAYVPSSRADRAAEEIEAPDIISFGGLLFTAKIYHGPDNQHRMTFLREEAVPNAAACEAQGIALIADLETKVGAFQWPGKLVTGEHLVHVGTGSTAEVSGWSAHSKPVPRQRFRDPGTTGFGLRSRKAVGQGLDRVQMDVIAELEKRRCVLKFALQRGMS